MRFKISTILPILLIMSVIQKVCIGINCYQCKSSEDKNCGTKSADRKYLKECPRSHRFCRKLDSIYYFTDSRDYITIRECAMFRTEGQDCYHGRYNRDSYQRVCECGESGCNRSPSLHRGTSMILLLSQLFLRWVLPS
ncbi:uncharacterized protein [Venturia canescens]|uniref:uncharacterized protein n=1 Tax=Venturia canescens TaxID=32260 RepID=UPI001C9D37A8|nr:uncharacterized protein LOC122407956 [Venturia canescens]